MIDTKEMKNASDRTDSLAPRLEVVRAHSIPAIQGDAPVLAPFLRERVVLEMRFGRRATRPLEHEFIRSRKNVCAIITDAKWNITHQRHAVCFGV